MTKKNWIRDTPMRRLGQPNEIASAVLFLAPDATSLMTGSIVPLRRRAHGMVSRR